MIMKGESHEFIRPLPDKLPSKINGPCPLGIQTSKENIF